jgi:hypothetical protein
MCKEMHTTYWGKKESDIKTQDPQARVKMGLPKDKKEWVRKDCQNEEAESLYKSKGIRSEHLNARQVFSKVRGKIPTQELKKPNPCNEQPPEEINVFSDGSFRNPRKQAWSLSAAGVWWPGRRMDEEDLTEAEDELAMQEQEKMA